MSKYELLLPKMGESVAEATIIKWLKAPGDPIEVDEAIMEIATDKVDSEIPSPVSGKLVQQICKEDDVVEVGSVIAIIETEVAAQHEASIPVPVPVAAPPVQQQEPVTIAPAFIPPVHHEEPVIVKEQDIPGISQLKQEEAPAQAAVPIYGERFYSPLVKNIAATENISVAELDTIPGTGAEGRLTKDDLQAYLNRRASMQAEKAAPVSPVADPVIEHVAPSPEPIIRPEPVSEHIAPTPVAEPEPFVPHIEEAKEEDHVSVTEAKAAEFTPEPFTEEVKKAAPTPEPEPLQPIGEREPVPQPISPPVKPVLTASSGDEIIEMDRMRRLIADHMVMSKHTSPHVTSFVEADVTNLVKWRERIKDTFEQTNGERITYTPIFIEAVVKAIKDMPLINSSVNGNTIIKKKDINIGMATALPSGNLIVPVIHKASSLNLTGLTKAVNDLAARARANKLQPDEVKNGTFTITNVGSFGNVMGTPIINQPQVAIMAVGIIKKKPAVIETKDGDMIAIRHMMFLSLSYDHRVIDGALGGSFLRRVADYLENWDLKTEI